ncbi:dehydratase [Croceicoccus estronivorus]|uniref:MaoC family dehydratase n=1 Tax=Croceicoccus estronivorus TaxID=1172626 RepID=UPI00082A6C2A|nr:MaoC family dehydratase [Croceicoccus estronivorus]OCC23538.1 dehydratase [Croceicoccus estronivorus]
MDNPTVFETPNALLGQEGTDLGVTEWFTIGQDRIDTFAEATEDRQWIHVDAERAASSVFGGTIAHGFLTLGLFAYFIPQLITVNGAAMGINAGVDRVRFLTPVRAGSRVRARGEIFSVEEKKGAVQLILRLTIEIEGSDKPACVGDSLARYVVAS